MKDLKFKRTQQILNLSNKNQQLFKAMNVAMIIGGLSLISTFLYLLVNLNKVDDIIIYCVPGFVLGLTLMILYAVGYQKLTKTSKPSNFVKALSFGK